jgi:CxxC motif-containing protein (DUF1111 family)
VRQARFVRDESGKPDGTVHPLFTITGRVDAEGCILPQPEFLKEIARHNISFRIPSPLFGLGLIEAIPDPEIEGNARKDSRQKKALGISGHPNRSSTHSISRYGWKAQTASLEVFVAEAYAIEQGVTNELFRGQGDDAPSSCLFIPSPEDRFLGVGTKAIDGTTNVTRVSYFLRFLSPVPPGVPSPDTEAGKQIFKKLGCALCHTASLRTGRSAEPVLSERQVNLYSDLLVHHMGAQLADGIRDGDAGPDEFRTAPLWGLRGRLFYLHDGRTKDLSQAILLHAGGRGSEAAKVIERYRSLPDLDHAQLLAFLRSL